MAIHSVLIMKSYVVFILYDCNVQYSSIFMLACFSTLGFSHMTCACPLWCDIMLCFFVMLWCSFFDVCGICLITWWSALSLEAAGIYGSYHLDELLLQVLWAYNYTVSIMFYLLHIVLLYLYVCICEWLLSLLLALHYTCTLILQSKQPSLPLLSMLHLLLSFLIVEKDDLLSFVCYPLLHVLTGFSLIACWKRMW